MTRLIWDPMKEAENRRKHRTSFEEACTVFADLDQLSVFDEDHSEQEDRWVTMGMSEKLRVLVVVHASPEPDGNGDEVIRIISARAATAEERKQYMRRKT